MEPWERQHLDGWSFVSLGIVAKDWDTGKNVWISSTSKDDIKFSGLNPSNASFRLLIAWAKILVAKASAHGWILKQVAVCKSKIQPYSRLSLSFIIKIMQWSSFLSSSWSTLIHFGILVAKSQEHTTGAAFPRHWHFSFPAHPNKVCGRQSHVTGPELGCQGWLVLDVSWRATILILDAYSTMYFSAGNGNFKCSNACFFLGTLSLWFGVVKVTQAKIGNRLCRSWRCMSKVLNMRSFC